MFPLSVRDFEAGQFCRSGDGGNRIIVATQVILQGKLTVSANYHRIPCKSRKLISADQTYYSTMTRATRSAIAFLWLFHSCRTANGFVSSRSRPFVSTSLDHATGKAGDHEPISTMGQILSSPGEAIERLGLSSAPTVWTEFGRIAQEFEPVNLGQGFPDWLPPKFAVDSLVEAVLDSAQSPHQYTRPAGHPNLVKQLARRYSIHTKRDINPMEEVAVTVGASQALYLSLQVLIKPGRKILFGIIFYAGPRFPGRSFLTRMFSLSSKATR